jgi:hypothetical protein
VLVTLKKRQLERKSRTATEDAFLTALDPPLNDAEEAAFDEKLMLAVFLQELCKLVKITNEKTASPGDVKSRNYELAEYLLATIFTNQSGIPLEHLKNYARAVNACIVETRRGESVKAASKRDQACQIFFSEVFGYEIDLDWMRSTRMLDQCLTKKKLTHYKDIKASFVKELIHQGKTPKLCSSDTFLESMLIDCGDSANTAEDEEDVSDEILQLRSAAQRSDQVVRCVEDLFSNPKAENWRRLADAASLSPELKNRSDDLGQNSRDTVLLQQLMMKFNLPLFIRTAFELAKRHNEHAYILQARQAFCRMSGGIVPGQYSEILWQSIEQDILDTFNSGTDVADEVVSALATASEVVPSSGSGGAVDSNEDDSDSEPGPSLGNDLRNQVNRLFTAEGLHSSQLHLLFADGTPSVRGTYGSARWACMTGNYLRIEDFKLFKCFGQGSEGVVCAAYHGDLKDKKMVALKFMLINDREEYLNYFDRSTANWFKVNGHENIVLFLGYGQVESLHGRPLPFEEKIMMFQAMEICKCDLQTLLKQKQHDLKKNRLSFQEYCHFFANVMLEVAKGWSFLASNDIVHRDM